MSFSPGILSVLLFFISDLMRDIATRNLIISCYFFLHSYFCRINSFSSFHCILWMTNVKHDLPGWYRFGCYKRPDFRDCLHHNGW
jgi:hypothetical protein